MINFDSTRRPKSFSVLVVRKWELENRLRHLVVQGYDRLAWKKGGHVESSGLLERVHQSLNGAGLSYIDFERRCS